MYKILHLESTDVCQAACPQCAREVDANFNKDATNHLTVDRIKQCLSDDIIRNLDKMYMCGNYGDPAAGRYTVDIFKYFRSVNPDIVLGMNTNGAINNSQWWKELAMIFNGPKDYVVFSIDGLEDTNHMYRKNVVWSKLTENAKSFITAGGLAHWDMLVFDHNKHQVDACKKFAQDSGFYFFRAKVSRRHKEYPVEFLKAPAGWKNPNIVSGDIRCAALQENSLYISAEGIMHPCCWLGFNNGATLQEFDKIKESWDSNPHTVCKSTCGNNNSGNSFTNQWQQEIQLK